MVVYMNDIETLNDFKNSKDALFLTQCLEKQENCLSQQNLENQNKNYDDNDCVIIDERNKSPDIKIKENNELVVQKVIFFAIQCHKLNM